MNEFANCLVCFELTQHKLECQHFVCIGCLSEIIKEKLNTLQLRSDDFCCPQCLTIYNMDIFAKFDLYKKIVEYSIQHNCIQGLNQEEKMVDCGNDECNNKFIVSKNAKYSKCPQCKKIYCLQCNKPYESGCCLQTISGKCPRCKIQVFKNEGCNFVCCKSQVCKGQVYFCTVCFISLKKEDHYNHFIDNNPYNDCKFRKIKPNKQQCPGCLTLNPILCQLDEIQQVFICKSQYCKNSVYCLKCKQQIKFNEKHECKQNLCKLM